MIDTSPVVSDDHDQTISPDKLDTASVLLHNSASGEIIVSDWLIED